MANLALATDGGRVPGPRGWPMVGVLPSLLSDPFRYLMDSAAAHEGLVRLHVGPADVFLVSHPDYVHQVLVSNAKNYNKGRIMQGIRAALGDGLFTSDGELWRRQRRLMQPAFHQSQIREMVATIRDETTRRVDAWQPALAAGQPLDMVDETIRLNIRIVLKTLFGSGVDEDQATEMVKETGDVFAGMSKRLWTFFAPPWLPLPGQRAYRGAITALEKRIYALMEDRRRRTTKEHDLLGALLQARDEETGEAMPDQRIRDEIFTLFLAGYESTATGVSWAWYLLAQHPEVAQRLRAEADAQLGTRDPEMEDLAKLPYAKRVVDEVFRLYPVFPMFFRTSIEADRIGPYAVPADASIVISPYATHRDPRFWNEPTRFDPDRFLPDRFTPRHGDAYYPFGKGQRLCIGKAMALTTAQVVISMIVRRFDLALAPGRNVEEHFAMTLQPKGGLPMLLRPRAAGRSS